MNTKGVVLISGGSRGLGEGIVHHLLKQHYAVATFSRNKSSSIDALQKGKYKKQFYWEKLDVDNFSKLKKLPYRVIEHFGQLDALINNAAIVSQQLLTLTPRKIMSNILKVNVESVMILTQATIKPMLIKQDGIIINISSINAIRGHTGISIYSATKAALDGFTRSLAKELGSRGIRVNSISPGFLQTEMTDALAEKQKQQIIRRTPLGRLGKIDDLLGIVSFLLSKEASFITGQTMIVDGGLSC